MYQGGGGGSTIKEIFLNFTVILVASLRLDVNMNAFRESYSDADSLEACSKLIIFCFKANFLLP